MKQVLWSTHTLVCTRDLSGLRCVAPHRSERRADSASFAWRDASLLLAALVSCVAFLIGLVTAVREVARIAIGFAA